MSGVSDACDLSATSHACRARGIWRTTQHTDKRAALYITADRRPTNQVSVWKLNGELIRHIRHASRMSARMSRECYEETAPVEFQLKPAREQAPTSINTSVSQQPVGRNGSSGFSADCSSEKKQAGPTRDHRASADAASERSPERERERETDRYVPKKVQQLDGSKCYELLVSIITSSGI